jgi:hypothetical protein
LVTITDVEGYWNCNLLVFRCWLEARRAAKLEMNLILVLASLSLGEESRLLLNLTDLLDFD